ncbi:WG repeat-containing protein [Candidatus Obscuribacterales bacterium]|nr:WG repeat-containing protein [Candidatus Obscuribacterales bacterium]
MLAAFLLSVINAIPSAQAFPYSKFGLIDRTGKEIVPCRYRRAEYMGHDIFLFEEPPSLAGESPVWLLCDRDGRKIDIKIPNEGNPVKLFFFEAGKWR